MNSVLKLYLIMVRVQLLWLNYCGYEFICSLKAGRNDYMRYLLLASSHFYVCIFIFLVIDIHLRFVVVLIFVFVN